MIPTTFKSGVYIGDKSNCPISYPHHKEQVIAVCNGFKVILFLGPPTPRITRSCLVDMQVSHIWSLCSLQYNPSDNEFLLWPFAFYSGCSLYFCECQGILVLKAGEYPYKISISSSASLRSFCDSDWFLLYHFFTGANMICYRYNFL